jgi:hypothetical protein
MGRGKIYHVYEGQNIIGRGRYTMGTAVKIPGVGVDIP